MVRDDGEAFLKCKWPCTFLDFGWGSEEGMVSMRASTKKLGTHVSCQ